MLIEIEQCSERSVCQCHPIGIVQSGCRKRSEVTNNHEERYI